MKWVQKFYTSQYIMADRLITNEVDSYHRQLVDKVENIAQCSVIKILELGGGQGGFAVAAAKRGHKVTVVELIPSAADQIHLLAKKHGVEQDMQIIQGDFYNIDLPNDFDIVCYWDGFGIGSDDDQSQLLTLISNWLSSRGTALIDIYTPWYWSHVPRQKMQLGKNSFRRYGFDAEGCRMLDTWWAEGVDEVTQSLRCYSPADLTRLAIGTGLLLDSFESGGAMDYEKQVFHKNVPLVNAMSYLAILTK